MTPVFKIKVGGTDYTDMIMDRLVELRLVDNAGRVSDYLELALDDRATIPRPTHGEGLDVWLGYAETGTIFKGRFIHDETEFEGPLKRMTIRAAAVNFRGDFKAPRSRSFDDITLGELAESIAKEHGYNVYIDDIFASVLFPHLDQTAESDLRLLTRLAKHYGATFKIAGDKLLFISIGDKKNEELQELFGTITIHPEDISTWHVLREEKSHFNSVKANWYDKDAAELKSVTAGTNKPVKEMKYTYSDADAAGAAAQAELDRITRKKAALTISMPGNPKLITEGSLIMEDFRDGVDGKYTPKRVEHIITKKGGYKCKVTAELSK